MHILMCVFEYLHSSATAYGKGVYFAQQSSYSVNYAAAGPTGEKKMIIAKVLVGESTAGNSSMQFLPNRTADRTYDSASGPNMSIIFHDSQAYPEYIITFS